MGLTLENYLGIAGFVVAAAGFIVGVAASRRKKVADAKTEIAAAFQAGRDDRNDEVALLKSENAAARRDQERAEREQARAEKERDDARADRDEARRQLAWMQRPGGYPEPYRPHPPRRGQ